MIRRLRTDLASVIGFFTRLPVGALMPVAARIDMAGAVWAFPLAGALVGLAGGVIASSCRWLQVAPLPGACWALATMLLLSGALHEDGLADMVDGFGGGRDKAHKLAIMRDSRIGSYAALALLLSTVLRVAAVAALPSPGRICAGLVVSGALSRLAIVLLLVLIAPARGDGVAASLGRIRRGPALGAAAIGLTLDVALLRGWRCVWALAAMLLVTLVVAWLASRKIGGHTGDVLGAGAVLAECAVLSCL